MIKTLHVAEIGSFILLPKKGIKRGQDKIELPYLYEKYHFYIHCKSGPSDVWTTTK